MSALTLIYIQNQINNYGYMVMMILGSIGNVFILILFNRQRQNACSIYLTNAAVTNLVYLISNFFLKTFAVSYANESIGALIFCKFSNFIPGYLGQVAKTILIWACIDRYLITSRRATFRAFSTPKRAKYLIFFTYIGWLVAASHLVIFSSISNGQCTRAGIYGTIFTFYAILLVGLIPSVILSIFGFLTYGNMKHLRSRIQPTGPGDAHAAPNIQRRDRDLLILVIAEVIVYVITTALFPIVLLETLISNYILEKKSFYYFIAEIFALNISFYLLYIFSAAPFYIYMVASTSFRRDWLQLIVFGYRKLMRQPIEPSVSQTK